MSSEYDQHTTGSDVRPVGQESGGEAQNATIRQRNAFTVRLKSMLNFTYTVFKTYITLIPVCLDNIQRSPGKLESSNQIFQHLQDSGVYAFCDSSVT